MSAPDHAELIHAKKIAADIGRFVARGAQVTRAAFTRAISRWSARGKPSAFEAFPYLVHRPRPVARHAWRLTVANGAAPGRAGPRQRHPQTDADKKLLTPTARRTAVRRAIEEQDYSQRRACAVVELAPKVYCYRRRSDDGVLHTRLRSSAAHRRRFGYRRLHLLLRREGFTVNHEKLFRIDREERLAVRKRGGRKRALGMQAPAAVPQGQNQRWSLDFVSDTFADGRRFRKGGEAREVKQGNIQRRHHGECMRNYRLCIATGLVLRVTRRTVVRENVQSMRLIRMFMTYPRGGVKTFGAVLWERRRNLILQKPS